MMRLVRATVIGVSLCAVLLVAGCGDDDSDDTSSDDPAAVLYGEWMTAGGTTVTYGEDGTWSAQLDAYGTDPFDFGTFVFDGEVIEYSTDAGSESCSEGQTGVYEVTITEAGELDLDEVEDPCRGRSSDFLRGMSPASG